MENGPRHLEQQQSASTNVVGGWPFSHFEG